MTNFYRVNITDTRHFYLDVQAEDEGAATDRVQAMLASGIDPIEDEMTIFASGKQGYTITNVHEVSEDEADLID